MKVLAILAVVIYATAADLTDEAVSEKWNSFKVTYQKNYLNSKEESFRKQLFVKKLQHIEEHNEKFRQGLETYEIGVNKFTDMTTEEMKSYTGLVVPKEFPQPLIEITSRASLGLDEKVKAPNSFDWRDQGAVSQVKNQGGCGSCWAFSSTGALEAQVKIVQGKSVLASEQQLVDCVTDNYGCGGGWMTTAFAYIAQAGGIDSDEAYPYEAVDGSCHYRPEKSVAHVEGFAELKQADEELMAEMVATKGPVSVAIDADGDFASYVSGVYYNADCDREAFNHAVLVVGYGSEGGQDYWIVKNSWGINWGDNGYIKMARNRNNHCGIASKTKFDKNYPDAKENNRRKQIFIQYLQQVEDHNKKYEAGSISYSIGVNQFSDWTDEEKRKYH
ncbi:cathepsin L1 [Asbolus verrucosus]|uniref:Cathepsin L1 n=1 Tax=Asbolus verrucosus TaxID=1661398 RepID=A0A482VZI4_ASBVE|nr:cathepsin L1 [Asbolus verrucosus]